MENYNVSFTKHGFEKLNYCQQKRTTTKTKLDKTEIENDMMLYNNKK